MGKYNNHVTHPSQPPNRFYSTNLYRCSFGTGYIKRVFLSLILSPRFARQLIGISLMASALRFYVKFVSELFGRSWFLSLTMNRIAAAYSSVCMEFWYVLYRQKCQCGNSFSPKRGRRRIAERISQFLFEILCSVWANMYGWCHRHSYALWLRHSVGCRTVEWVGYSFSHEILFKI